MRIEEEIINQFEKILVQMAGRQDGPGITPEMKAYNEGIIDSFTTVNDVIDKYEMSTEDGRTEVTVGWLGGAESLSFETVNEAIQTLSSDYSSDMYVVEVPSLPMTVILEMEMFRQEDMPIWQLFDKAKQMQNEEWAQWALANSEALSTAWITKRYNIL